MRYKGRLRLLLEGGGGGGGGALEEKVISKYFTNWGGSNLFDTHPGKVTVFFGKENIIPCRLVDFCLLTNTRSVEQRIIIFLVHTCDITT